MSRLVSFLVLLVAIIVTSFFFYRLMASFILPLFLAVLAVVIFQPVYRWLLGRFDGRKRWAGGITTALVLCTVLIPIVGITAVATIQGIHVVAQLDANTLRAKAARLRNRLPILQMPDADAIHRFETELDSLLTLDPRFAPPSDPARELQHRRTMIEPLLASLSELEPSALDTPETAKIYDDLQEKLEQLKAADGPTIGSLEFDAAIQVVAAKYRELKVAILGGPLLASIKDLANPTDQDLKQLSSQIFFSARGWLFRLGGQTSMFLARAVLGLVIMVIAMYFFFIDGPAMVQTFMRLSPLDDEYERVLLNEFDSVNRAVVLATLLSALAQALLSGVAYWFLGLPAVMLLTVLTGALAMLPFVGTAVIWVPVSLWLYFYEERTGAAIFLFLYGALVVSMIDNLIKPWVLHGRSKLHPLLALLSVLGGVKALGPIGIVAGPMAAAFLQTLLNLLHREIMALDSPAGPLPVALASGGPSHPSGEPPESSTETLSPPSRTPSPPGPPSSSQNRSSRRKRKKGRRRK